LPYQIGKSPGSFGSVKKLYGVAKKKIPDLKLRDVENWIYDQDTYTLFRQPNKKFPRLPILVNDIDEQWQADLMDMTWVSRWNNNNKYIFVVIDCLSRYAWAIAVKDKSARTIVDSFKKIISDSGRKPEKLQTDQGKEFVNNQLRDYLKSINVNHFLATDGLIKCAIVERFNRTLRNRIYRYFHYKDTKKYIDNLSSIMEGYNKSYHRTIKMSPEEALDDYETARTNIFDGQEKSTRKQKPYKVGDGVRITSHKLVFEKDATAKWKEEIFKIAKVKHTPQGYVYRLVDWGDEPITSIFYHDELFPAKYPELYKTTVLKTRINPKTKKKEYFVNYRGYPDKFNTWVDHVE
jgi:transposase InsO family protein